MIFKIFLKQKKTTYQITRYIVFPFDYAEKILELYTRNINIMYPWETRIRISEPECEDTCKFHCIPVVPKLCTKLP